MELNGHPKMTLKDYSYGTCRVAQVGPSIYVYLLAAKGKLTDEKLLKPLKKVFIDYDNLEQAGKNDEVITLHNPHNVTEKDAEVNRGRKFPKVNPMLLTYCAVKITVL